jgi:hypothetical protein
MGSELSVVFISYGEIASARLVRERVEAPDPTKVVHKPKTLRYVELRDRTAGESLADGASRERSYGETLVR